MTTQTLSPARLLVILDPDYGDRLREVSPGQPVWITMSPVNTPVIRSLWATHPDSNHLTGITGFGFDTSVPADECFLAELDTIDLHHGPYSTVAPYTQLEVIGVPLATSIRTALSRIGFAQFSEGQNGFIATRTHEEASRLRS
jgi:hypothetical protein